MFTDDMRDCYHLFRETPHPRDAYARHYRQTERLAFAMAARRNVPGALIDQFRQMSPPVDRKAARKLRKAVFKVHGRPGKHPIEQETYQLYRGLVAEFRQFDDI
jgi:hypothetical protein